MSARALIGAVLLALVLCPSGGALVAVADDGRPPSGQAGRPSTPAPIPASQLRPSAIRTEPSTERSADVGDAAPLTKAPRRSKELVVFVGGYGSEATDGAFNVLAASFDPREYDVVRFGTDPRFPYDTYGSVDRSGAALTAQIRAMGSEYTGVNIVSHSMGGLVVDRAFAQGLSAADGVKTEVALAGAHSGADYARAPTIVLPLLGPVRDIVRAASLDVARDPESEAARDLATARPIAPPRGIVRVDASLATDGFVNQRDARDPGVPQRVYLPSSIGEVFDGHGGSLTNREIRVLVTETVRTHSVPPDRRDVPTLLLAPVVWPIATNFWLALLVSIVLGALLLVSLRNFPIYRGLIDAVAVRCATRVRLRGR